MPFKPAVTDRERDKFIEHPSGETSVRVYVGNTDPIPVSGTFSSGNASTPAVYNLSMPLSGTEYSQALSAGTKRILVRMRVKAAAKLAFVSGDSGTLFLTLNPGTVFIEENLDLNGVTIYLQSNEANQVAEILEWT